MSGLFPHGKRGAPKRARLLSLRVVDDAGLRSVLTCSLGTLTLVLTGRALEVAVKGQRIGYVRVSTVDQNGLRQIDGQILDRVFTDKASGRDTARPSPKSYS